MQGNADVVQYIRPLHILRLGLQSLRCLPAAVTASCVGKCSQQLPEQPLTALLCQGDTAADKQQRITPLHQATKQPGQTAASQGGPGQKPGEDSKLLCSLTGCTTFWCTLCSLVCGPCILLPTWVSRALQLSSAWFCPCSEAAGHTGHSAEGGKGSVSLATPQDLGERACHIHPAVAMTHASSWPWRHVQGHRQFAGPEGCSASPASLQARTAVSLIPTVIEEEFNASQFLEGCKGAFVAGAWQPWIRTCSYAVKSLLWLVTQACCPAWLLWRGRCSLSGLTVHPLHSCCSVACPAVHESMHSTRDLAAMVSLPVLNAYA